MNHEIGWRGPMAMTIFLHKQVVSTSMMVSRSAKKNIYIYIHTDVFTALHDMEA